jgi:hypothetical protein
VAEQKRVSLLALVSGRVFVDPEREPLENGVLVMGEHA